MTIYEIDKAIRDVLENGFSYDEETGEILFDDSNIRQLEVARDEKLESIAIFHKELLAEAEAIKAEKQNLEKRQKAVLNKAEYMKNLLSFSLQGEKFKTARVAVSYRTSETVEIAEGTKLPDEYLRFKEPEPDKVGLKKALKEGKEIEGCTLISNQNIQIK